MRRSKRRELAILKENYKNLQEQEKYQDDLSYMTYLAQIRAYGTLDEIFIFDYDERLY